MKTTVDLPLSLLNEAKKYAQKHSITLREIVERGIQSVLSGKDTAKAFKLKDFSVVGKGLQSGVSLSDWGKIRDEIYKGRGT